MTYQSLSINGKQTMEEWCRWIQQPFYSHRCGNSRNVIYKWWVFHIHDNLLEGMECVDMSRFAEEHVVHHPVICSKVVCWWRFRIMTPHDMVILSYIIDNPVHISSLKLHCSLSISTARDLMSPGYSSTCCPLCSIGSGTFKPMQNFTPFSVGLGSQSPEKWAWLPLEMPSGCTILLHPAGSFLFGGTVNISQHHCIVV